MFWDISKSLSYNALFNFIVGNRGGGKTFGTKEYVIKRFLNHGEQFIYVRRYKTELKGINKFFNDIKDKFPNVKLEVKGRLFYINDEVAGQAVPLSTAKVEKSVPFPLVTTIIFDEFIIDKGTYHYLQDEVTNFLELYETIARMRDVKVYFLSNALTVTNPYFIYFDLSLPYGNKNIACKNDILIEMVCNPDFVKAKEQTRFAKIIKNTTYAEYAINNKFLRDDTNFVQKKTAQSKYYFTMLYKGDTYGVWTDYSNGLMFISNDYDPCCKLIYSFTIDDHKPNVMLLKGARSSVINNFVKYYKLGLMRFETINIKNICTQIIKATL